MPDADGDQTSVRHDGGGAAGRDVRPSGLVATPRTRLLHSTLALVALLAVAACGGSTTTTAATSSSTDTTSTTASTSASTTTSVVSSSTTEKPPHFDTPEAAMAYLATAWNASDQVSLRHVTNPSAREELEGMHEEAVNLQLNRCERREGQGDYVCYFDHAYPDGYVSKTPSGEPAPAVFLVGPADTPGWYMTVFQSCG